MTDTVLACALSAHAAGLCPIPARTDGSKRPIERWKRWQSERPDEAQLTAWFDDWPNLGVVCGTVSDRLLCVEFEGRFMGEGWTAMMATADPAALALLRSWAEGYSEMTPSGGLHILIHLGGDHQMPGNFKIASDRSGETLIETRGEGGFVITAPSNGTTHQSGGAWVMRAGGWDSICWVQPDELALVLDALGALDERPAPVPVPVEPSVRLGGDGFIEASRAYWPAMASVLEGNGWQHVGADRRGQLWTRPGKDPRLGHSATVNERDRLYVFSSSSPVPQSLHDQTYDVVDVVHAHSTGRLPTMDERIGLMRQWSPPAAVRAAARTAARDEGPPPSPASEYLDEEFWSSAEWLSDLRAAALTRRLAPEGVLGAFIAIYATYLPTDLWVPPMIGADSPLNVFSALVGQSASGKTASMAVARELLPRELAVNSALSSRRAVNTDVHLRSGEGLIREVRHEKPGPTKNDPPEITYTNVCVNWDEAVTLARQTERNGQTTIGYLCTAWAGSGSVGGAKASGTESFPADFVRVCAVMGVQFGAAAGLFTGESRDVGFPGRFGFWPMDNPAILGAPRTYGRAPIEPLRMHTWRRGELSNDKRNYLDYPRSVWDEVYDAHDERTTSGGEALDNHTMLTTLRMAGIFALAEGSSAVSDHHWNQASACSELTRATRSKMLAAISNVDRERARAAGRADSEREFSKTEATTERLTKRLEAWLALRPDGATRKELRGRLSSAERPLVDDVIAHGLEWGLFVQNGGRYFGGL